jgi:hypothetical protein
MTLKISIPKALPPPELPAWILPDVAIIREKYPRIGEKISLLWGSIELQKYLNNLIFDERGDREGFPPSTAAAILRILKDHGKLVAVDDGDVWNI